MAAETKIDPGRESATAASGLDQLELNPKQQPHRNQQQASTFLSSIFSLQFPRVGEQNNLNKLSFAQQPHPTTPEPTYLGESASAAIALLLLNQFGSHSASPLQHTPNISPTNVPIKGVVALSQGLPAMKEVFQKDLQFQGAFAQTWGKRGRYSGTYIDYEAVAASLDPGGGFEMNDYTMNVIPEALASFKAKVTVLLRAAQHVMEGVLRRIFR